MPTKDPLNGLEPELVDLVLSICKSYTEEDRTERDNRRPLWLKLENYFQGLTDIYWDFTAKDWRSLPDEENAGDNKNRTNRHYDKIINIYKAHAESIIAALSIKTPNAIFYPDDAEVEEDIVTAKACVKVKENIERINRAQLLLVKALVVLYNQGIVAGYTYNDKHSKYGTYTKPNFGEDKTIYTVQENCQECGSNLGETVFESSPEKVLEEVKTCNVCGHTGIPLQESYEEQVPVIIGTTVEPKSKTCIDIYSPLFAYMPFYARKQEDMPYIALKFESHFSKLKNLFPNLRKQGHEVKPSLDYQNASERGILIGVNSFNLSTVECWWVRDWGYDISTDDDRIKKLKNKFPDGFYAIILDNKLVEIHNEALDEHWTISSNPLSTYIHADPLGKVLAPIQDLENEVIDLQIETFEHAIPETHARADVVDFKKYAKEQARPGMMYPVNAPADGTALSQAFHTIKTASLSEEADLFLKRLDEKAQFVSKSFPSIYGGPAISGSKTAREYTESRSMALQSLGLTWNVLKFFWADLMSKAVPLYIRAFKTVGQDEKIVTKTSTGFINNWIRQTDLEGNVGRVEADTDEEMPLSASQLKGLLTELMALKDINISEALYHPQNAPLVKKALGATDFYIPGSDERDKQYSEFIDLLNGVYVEVKEWEKHDVEGETCRAFLVSPTGLMLKKYNSEGYAQIEMHMQEHLQFAAMKQPAPGAENPEKETANV